MQLISRGAFGTPFSWQNTMVRAALPMLTGCCTALPLRLGMVIIGGEVALAPGAPTAAGTAHLLPNLSPAVVILAMALTGSAVGVTSYRYMFIAAPHMLTLAIMMLTSSRTRTLIGVPAELTVSA